jgi:hypothetical protein
VSSGLAAASWLRAVIDILGLPIVQGRPGRFPGHRIWGLRDRVNHEA